MEPVGRISGEETVGKPPQEPPSPGKLRCFRETLDVVFSLSDEEWTTLTTDVPLAVTKVQFSSLCSNIVTSVCKSAIQSYLSTLIPVVGMDAVFLAEEKLKKKASSQSVSSPGSTAVEETRSTDDPSDMISNVVEDFVREVKTAMQTAIGKVASCKDSFWSKDWRTTCSRVAREMFDILEVQLPDCRLEDPTDLKETRDKSGELSSPEFPSSIASDTNLEAMLDAMAQSGFPTDLTESHQGDTSRDIPTTRPYKTTKLHHVCRKMNERVKSFFRASKKPRSSEPDHSMNDSGSVSPKLTPADSFQSRDGKVSAHSGISQVSTKEKKPATEDLEPRSAVSVGPPPHLIPRIQVNIDSCLGEVVGKVVELYRSELVLPSSSKVSLHDQLKTDTTSDFMTEAVKVVSEVLVKEVSSQISVAPSRQASSSPSSTTSEDLERAALVIVEAVIDSVKRHLVSKISTSPTVNSSCEILSSLDALSHISVSSLSEEAETSKKMSYSNPLYVFRRVKHLLHQLFMGAGTQSITTTSIATSQTESDHETMSSAITETTVLGYSSPNTDSAQHQDTEDTSPHAGSEVSAQSNISKNFSDSPRVTSWVRDQLLRDSLQKSTSLSQVFADESVKTVLQHMTSSPVVLDEETPGTSGGLGAQDRPSVRSSSAPCTFIDEECLFTEVLTDTQSQTEDNLSLLVCCEDGISESKREILEMDFTGSPDAPTTSSSSVDPDPPTVERSRRRFFSIHAERLPLIRRRVKKFIRVRPAGTASDHPEPASSLFKKTRKHLSRVFSTIRKALPNPFQ